MLSENKRLELGMEYLRSVQSIGPSTNVAVAQRNWNFLQQYGAFFNPTLIQPVDGGSDLQFTILRIIHPSRVLPRETQPLGIIPLVPEDNNLLEALNCSVKIDDKWAACYMQAQHLIFLKTWTAATHFERGVSLLHEAGHSFRAHQSGCMLTHIHQLEPDEAAEEAEMHYMEAQLWKERGGQPYLDLLDKVVYRVGKLLKGKTIYHSLPRNDAWLTALAAFLGDPVDDSWSSQRMGKLTTFAHFEYYERNPKRFRGGTVQDCRVQAMIAIHKEFWARRAANRSLK